MQPSDPAQAPPTRGESPGAPGLLVSLLLLFLLATFGNHDVSGAEKAEKEYRFTYLQTTGMRERLLDESTGRHYIVDWTPHSEPEALKTFGDALDRYLTGDEEDGQRLCVRGTLGGVKAHFEGSDLYDFTMTGWSIDVPFWFEEVVGKEIIHGEAFDKHGKVKKLSLRGIGLDTYAWKGQPRSYARFARPGPTPTTAPASPSRLKGVEAAIPRGHLAQAFIHPGMLHSQPELDFVKAKIAAGAEPWKSAYEPFRLSRYASLAWRAHPEPGVIRDLNGRWRGARELGDDALAAYAHGLQWSLTGNPAHARKAAEILNAHARALQSITGHDAKLLAGITGYKFCNAAELIRQATNVWPEIEQARFAAMLTKVYEPLIRDFFPKANGNWDASMIVTMLSIGVFCDDRAIYERAKEYFLHGSGNGALTNYVWANGQCQESARDQQHTQLGLGFLADACETAWKQGDDLWSACGHRLALGFEYTARYNLGEEVPVTGKKPISSEGRGRFRPIYEKVYHHYHERIGLELKFTRQVLEKIRPEGEHWDHASWGTLWFADQPAR